MHLGVEVWLEGVDQHDRIVELAVQPRRAHLVRVRARVYIGVRVRARVYIGVRVRARVYIGVRVGARVRRAAAWRAPPLL